MLTKEQVEAGRPNLSENGAFGQDAVLCYRALVLLSGLKLEVKGIKVRRGSSCYSIAKREYGFKGNKARVLAQLEAHLEEIGLRVQKGN